MPRMYDIFGTYLNLLDECQLTFGVELKASKCPSSLGLLYLGVLGMLILSLFCSDFMSLQHFLYASSKIAIRSLA